MYYFSAYCKECDTITIQKSRNEHASRGRCVGPDHPSRENTLVMISPRFDLFHPDGTPVS